MIGIFLILNFTEILIYLIIMVALGSSFTIWIKKGKKYGGLP